MLIDDLHRFIDRIGPDLWESPHQIWIKDTRFRFVFTSRPFADYVGLSDRRIVGRDETAFFGPEHVVKFRDDDLAAIRSGRALLVAERTGLTWYETVKVPLIGRSGAVEATLGISRPKVQGLRRQCASDPAQPRGSRQPTEPRWLARVRDRVEIDFARGIAVRALARDAGRHPNHVGRSFRRRYGMTIQSLVRWLRVSSAARALEDGTAKLAEVALESGFADQSHLSRDFKRELAVTPGEFRGRIVPHAGPRPEPDEARGRGDR